MNFEFECVGYKTFTSKKGKACIIAYFEREIESTEKQAGAGVECVSVFVSAIPTVGKVYKLFLVNNQWFANIE